MNLSEPFIRRPVATTLVMLAIVAFGVLAFLRLPVSQLPNVDFPTILVSAQLPGATAETIASAVATPLEREFSTIDGVESISSSSASGFTSITLQFTLDKPLDSAALDVQAAISRALPRLPRDLPAPPSFRKVNPADQPIVFLSLASESLPLFEVHRVADSRVAQTLGTLPGVAQVQIYGAQKYALRLRMDPVRLASRGVGLDDVARAVREANVNEPTGTLHGASRAQAIQASGQLRRPADYERVVLSYQGGAPLYLGDVGEAIDGVENDKTAAWIGSRRGIVLAVQKQPGANTVAVSDAVQRELPRLREGLPAGVDLEVFFDRAATVRESVRDVELTLVGTVALVALVIFGFLRRVAATLIPSLSMPLSVLATFAAMAPLGYGLDNLSLMALTLALGFVVDDSIVVLENVVRHVEMGKSPLQAALDGTREVGFTIVSMTLSLVAVFIPFLFLGGLLGRLFEEFAVTMAVAILVSGFVSLTLTPMLAARVLRPHSNAAEGPLARAVERAIRGATAAYDRTLARTLRHPALVLLVSLAVLVATAQLYQRIPKGFLPTEDTDQLFAATEAVEGISFPALVERQLEVNRIVAAHPDVETFMSSVGARGGVGGANSGVLFIRLRPRHLRTSSAAQIAAELQPALGKVAGLRTFVQVPPPIRIGGKITKSEYQLTLQSVDAAELYQRAPELAEELGRSGVMREVTTDLLLKNPELRVQIDRDRAAALGVSVLRVEEALGSAFGARQISTIYAADDTYPVLLEVDPRSARDASALGTLHVRSSTGALVPLAALARVEPGVGPLSVNHSGQLPAVTLSFNLEKGRGLNEAVDVATRAAERLLPGGVAARFQGAAEAFQSSFAGLGLLLGVAIFVIYVVLGILYESFLHPVTILSALPFAGFGALATLAAAGVELDSYGFVGIVLLVGLVKKNGIMMVDVAIGERAGGADPVTAILRACHLRFRPITMTTLAALLGTLPIALGLGAGGEARRPLGLAVVGGLAFSQLLTLYVTPVVYVMLERVRGGRASPSG